MPQGVPLAEPNLSQYKLSDAVTLFSQQVSITNQLWTVYVVATFAAAGYGASSGSFTGTIARWITVAVTIGFWGFTLGHLALLRQSLAIANSLEQEIRATVKGSSDAGVKHFEKSIILLAGTANPPWISTTIHLLIDCCVTAALWIRIALGG